MDVLQWAKSITLSASLARTAVKSFVVFHSTMWMEKRYVRKIIWIRWKSAVCAASPSWTEFFVPLGSRTTLIALHASSVASA
jgi:hypothetical protein